MSSENPYQSPDATQSKSQSRTSRPSPDPSVEHEPHLTKSEFESDEQDPALEPVPDVAAASLVDEDQVEHGVWDEPALSPTLAGAIPDDALTYDRWLAENISRTSRETTWRNTLLIALVAGPWSILGALLFQARTGYNAIILTCVIAPVSEEIMKAAASLWVVEKRPYLYSSKSQILLAAGASGLCFAAIENVMYLHVGLQAPTPGLATWRWTVCTALHTVCAVIAGMGLGQVWQHAMTTQTRPRISLATPYLGTAMLLHGVYNAAATVFSAMSS